MFTTLNKRSAPLKTLILLAASTLALAACGTSEGASSESSTEQAGPPNTTSIVNKASKDDAAIKLLPESVTSSGTLAIGIDGTKGKPWASLGKDGELEGLTVDVAHSLARIFDIEVVIKNTPFENLIPGLQADRFQLTIAPMLQTPERLKILDMMGWIHGGSLFMVRSDYDGDALSMSDAICGMVLGGVRGTAEAEMMIGQVEKCKAGGSDDTALKQFPKSTDNILALKSGRIDAIATSTAQIGYLASINPDLEASGKTFNSGLSSMAMAKGSRVTPAIIAGFQSFIDGGTYDELLKAYGLDELAMDKAILNAKAK